MIISISIYDPISNIKIGLSLLDGLDSIGFNINIHNIRFGDILLSADKSIGSLLKKQDFINDSKLFK